MSASILSFRYSWLSLIFLSTFWSLLVLNFFNISPCLHKYFDRSLHILIFGGSNKFFPCSSKHLAPGEYIELGTILINCPMSGMCIFFPENVGTSLTCSLMSLFGPLVNALFFVPKGGFTRCWAKKRTKIVAQKAAPSVPFYIGIVMSIKMEWRATIFGCLFQQNGLPSEWIQMPSQSAQRSKDVPRERA